MIIKVHTLNKKYIRDTHYNKYKNMTQKRPGTSIRINVQTLNISVQHKISKKNSKIKNKQQYCINFEMFKRQKKILHANVKHFF